MLTSECGYVAAINASSYKNESSNEGQAVNPIENEIAEILCPNDCAFNGDCVNGSCVCYKDFTADDCSISIYQKPSLAKLQGDGLCDKRVRPCKKVTVMGIGWLNSTNLTCHVVEFKVVNSSWKPNKTERSFPGSMVDLLLVDCFLPDPPVKQGYFDRSVEGTPAAGLTLSVSNDGIHKSNTNLTLITYDSACMTCNVTNGCSLKDNSCYINQYCFAPNEVHPEDFCYQCLPEVDKNTWTKRRVNHPPNITSQIAYYALYQENLELVFDVVDQEGMPVTLSLMDGSPKEAVMKDNVFYWNVTATKTTTFYLKATDVCQASSIFNFTVSLVDCQCQNNGSCSPLKPRGTGYYLCNCLPGFKGTECETNINECQSYPCYQGRCVDGINNYSCICDPGYDGRDCDHDINDCASSPCAHGNCTDLVDGYTCNCIPGYEGLQCDENIDECLSSPCFYGTCIDQVNSYSCQCKAGYTGHDCDIDIDECQPSPCINGNCTDQVNGFMCSCQKGFSGIRCEENINDCLPISCGNGTCVDHVNNYSCVCNVGYTGRHCEVLITHCSNDSCYPGVPCSENNSTITCGSCPSGFQGDGKNCKDIDDCVNHTCANGASCVDGINSYSCNCLVGFTGDHCKIDIDDCVNHTCRNGGSCVDGINKYSCDCQSGFTGNRCETDINDCVNHTCGNTGFCIDGINNYSCNCLAGFTGDHCETRLSSSLVSTQEATTKSTMSFQENTAITIIATATNQLWITSAKASSASQKISSTPSVKKPPTSLTVVGGIPTTSKEDKTTTAQPTTGQTETELVFKLELELRIQRTWNKDLENKNSQTYKELSSTLEIQITKQYSHDDNFVGVKIVSFRPGSVVAEFQLMFKTKLEDEEALAPLKKATEDGEMGPLSVDPGSLKIIKKDEAENKQNVPYTVIIGGSCGGFFVLALLSIFLIRYCQRRKVVNKKRVSDEMPQDVAFPKPEKYELQGIESKEDIVRYEETAMWKDTARNEELGILQDSARCEKLGFSNATYQEVGIPNAGVDYQESGISNDALGYHEQK